MFKQLQLLGWAAAMALAGMGAASAADYTRGSAGFSWSGLYAGVHAGYGWGEADSSTIVDIDINGGFLGGQVGYNIMMGNNIVVGIEADISASGIDGTRPPFGNVPQTTTHEIDWFGTIRGRVGVAMGDVLPYFTGGFAFADATRTTTAGGGASASASHDGYSLGAGVEWAFSDTMSAKFEYQYLNLGSEVYAFAIPGPDPVVDLKVHTLRVGVNAHFWTR